MRLLYNTGVILYFVTVYLASFFSKKAKLWISGRKNQALIRSNGCVWFHFASLGEFEQGRPVLEEMRALYPAKKIVITFFSPSGYEIRKNTPLADAVYYLPLDTAKNARNFIEVLQPEMAIFTKYEYWYYYFRELHSHNIPLYIISGIFRPKQVFFKWYGGLHRKMLGFVSHFFVQDEGSKKLLKQIGITNVTVSGDTRFDRVWANAQHPKEIPIIAEFKGDSKIFIAGSTWPPDDQLIASLTPDHPDWKFIIAPHEINEEKISDLMLRLPADTTARYSQLANNEGDEKNGLNLTSAISNLVIDNIGMLSSLYQYGNIAYIGGGFGAGIHNTLEAAAFGLPVIFGPEYSKFNEAKALLNLQAGFSIGNAGELHGVVAKLTSNEAFYAEACYKAKTYVEQNTGATATIIQHIETHGA